MSFAPRWPVPLSQALVWLTLAALAGCGSAPKSPPGTVTPRAGPAPGSERDGPEANPPSNLALVPDAEPRLETVRPGGPNKPYSLRGRDYVPLTGDPPYAEHGLASWYGKKFHGRRTSNGEIYDMYAMTAAHTTLPIPSYVRVRNPANGREVIVRINDRGPFHSGRIIDLSYAAAYKLDLLRRVAPVEVTRITFGEIRAGSWRRDGPAAEPAATDVAALQTPPAPEEPPVIVAAAPPEPLAAMPPTPVADIEPAPGFWVQLGAFRLREGADGFHRRVSAELDWLAPLLAVFSDPTAFRLQAGPYASRDEAISAAERVRDALKLVPLVVERR